MVHMGDERRVAICSLSITEFPAQDIKIEIRTLFAILKITIAHNFITRCNVYILYTLMKA
jgi:hypothetical protein